MSNEGKCPGVGGGGVGCPRLADVWGANIQVAGVLGGRGANVLEPTSGYDEFVQLI